MGKVIFRDGQPVQELRGTYGRVTFRVINGKTVANVRQKHQRLKDSESAFDKTAIIEQCVADIQMQMHDMREAIADREAIKKRVERLYGKYAQRCKDESELAKSIQLAYFGNRRKRPVDARKGVQYALKFGERSGKAW